MNAWLELLKESQDRIIFLDGGMGTTVEDRGVDILNSLWGSSALLSDDGLEINDGVHRDFCSAGAEVLIANTHNSAFNACKRFIEVEPGKCSAMELLHHLNQEAVLSARRIAPADQKVAVLAGMGSAEGAYTESSNLTVERALDYLEPQFKVLMDLDIDGIIFETLTTSVEMKAVAALVDHHNYDHYSIGLTCTKEGKTNGSVEMADVIDIFSDRPPLAAFVQCTRFDYVHVALEKLASALHAASSPTILGVYANDGRKYGKDGWTGNRTPPELYVEYAHRWVDIGARILGGCCGTQPEHIAALQAEFTS